MKYEEILDKQIDVIFEGDSSINNYGWKKKQSITEQSTEAESEVVNNETAIDTPDEDKALDSLVYQLISDCKKSNTFSNALANQDTELLVQTLTSFIDKRAENYSDYKDDDDFWFKATKQVFDYFGYEAEESYAENTTTFNESVNLLNPKDLSVIHEIARKTVAKRR